MAWLWYTLAGTAVFFAIAFLGGGYVGYVMSLTRRENRMQLHEPNPAEAAKEAVRDAGIEWFMAQNPEDVQLAARDGLTLRGHFLPAAKPSDKLAVFAHGIGSTSLNEFGAFARFYHEDLNFHILMPDHRAHGRSDGKYIGFAAREWQDLFDWAQAYAERLGPDTQVVLHGVSMGAATVMNANANNPPDYIKCVVEDCGYSNGYEMVSLSAKRDLKLRTPIAMWACALWFRVFTGRSLKRDTDPLGNAHRFARPMLFIHGADDGFVPADMSVRCHDAAACPKELWLVPGADHAFSYYIAKEEYESRLRAWFARWLKESVAV